MVTQPQVSRAEYPSAAAAGRGPAAGRQKQKSRASPLRASGPKYAPKWGAASPGLAQYVKEAPCILRKSSAAFTNSGAAAAHARAARRAYSLMLACGAAPARSKQRCTTQSSHTSVPPPPQRAKCSSKTLDESRSRCRSRSGGSSERPGILAFHSRCANTVGAASTARPGDALGASAQQSAVAPASSAAAWCGVSVLPRSTRRRLTETRKGGQAW